MLIAPRSLLCTLHKFGALDWFMTNLPITRRTFMVRFGGTALASAVGILAACGAPQGAGPTTTSTDGPKTTVAPGTTSAAAVVSKSGRVSLPTFVPPNAPPPDV